MNECNRPKNANNQLLTYHNELERTNGVRSQFNDIDKSHMHKSVRLAASRRPVLVTFHLYKYTCIM